MRRHLQRAVVRFGALVLADMAMFAAARGMVRAIRDNGVLGASSAQALGDLLPRGILGGWIYGTALFVALIVTGNYGAGDDRRDPARLMAASVLAAALALWAPLWSDGFLFVLPTFVLATLVFGIGLILERLTLDWAVRKLGIRSTRPARALFVGTHDEVALVSSGPAFGRNHDYRNVGYIDTTVAPTNGALGSISDLPHALLAQRAETVVVCGYLPDEAFKVVVQAARDAGCELLTVPRHFTVTGVDPQLVWRNGQPLIELTSPAVKGQELVLKRLIDICASGIGLILLAPLFVAVGVLIKLDSRGPILYQSRRWGRFGTSIGIWKFRTMVTNADELLRSDPELNKRFSSNIKLVDDPRITRVGKYLRRYSIDELPQLWNVFLGDLSLVGPRPKLLGEEEKYGAAWESVLAVRPGVTGLWQVSGRNATTYEERVTLDVRYASHPSVWEDLRILVRTIPVVLRGTGAH